MRRNPMVKLSLSRVALVAAALLLSACQTPPPPPAPKPLPPIEIRYHADAPSAVNFLARTVAEQLVNTPRPDQPVVPVEEFFNAQSAEITASGRALQQQLAAALTQSMAPLRFVPLDITSANTAQWALLASHSTPAPGEATQPGQWMRLQVALVESSTGRVFTRVRTYLNAAQFNSEPTAFFKDAPMYFTDKRHQERAGAVGGQGRVIDGELLLQSAVSDAITAYEAGRYDDAERGFVRAKAMSKDHPAALTGLYQTYWKQGRTTEAEQAFAELVAASVEAGSLSVKLLFKVGATAFVDSGDLPTQYRLWLKSIGQVVSSKERCVDVTGHASKSGSADYNERLSLQRAEGIVGLIAQTSRDARTRFKAAGRGFQDTIVGTGANDATDAIDRRVEFRVRSCS
ncbi:MAG: OmpA family protein [Burkholderiales bacterium]|nr:OmpA family protein [Burkholderiales bacterium]